MARDGVLVDAFESDKIRALLAYLAVESGREHRREFLAGFFWPEFPENRARRNLSNALYNLRRTLDRRDAPRSCLVSTSASIRFDPSGDSWLDVAAFESLVALPRQHEHQSAQTCERCLDWLEQAVALYRGELLAGFSLRDNNLFMEWQLFNSERLHREAALALENLITCLEGCRQIERALSHAWRLTELDPLSETAQRQLIRLLAMDGQVTQALAQYERFSRVLQAELGILPGPETCDLVEQVRAQVLTPGLPTAYRHNLHPDLTPFIGREKEVTEVVTRLREPGIRLLSIVGPGGSGKTRLAVEAARALLGDFHHGVYMVPLGAVSTPEGLLPAVFNALDLHIQKELDPEAQLMDYLRTKTMLLVIDSSEHVLEGMDLIIRLLETSPGSKVLATSRVRLELEFEHLFRLSGMAVPGDEDFISAVQSDAVQLFIDGTRRVRESYALRADNYTDVVRICRLVDGMPLGILLASAWVALFSPGEIATHIQESFDFLTVNWRDLPERLRSMRATLDYSWKLLSGREQEVLAGLSVFWGVFGLPEAEQVAGCTPQDLLGLVDKSIVQRMAGGRYHLHDLVRQYAAERLNRTPLTEAEVRDRHCAFYLDRVASMAAGLQGPGQREALQALDAEVDNIWAAWEWAVQFKKVDLIIQAVDALAIYFDLRWDFQRGERACRMAVERLAGEQLAGQELKAWVRLLIWQASFTGFRHRTEQDRILLANIERSCEQADAAGLDIRWERAFMWLRRGEQEQNLHVKLEYLERGLALFRDLGEPWWVARVLQCQGGAHTHSGDYASARERLEEGLELSRALGDPRGTAGSLMWMSYAHANQGQTGEALSTMKEAAELYQSLGDLYGGFYGLHHLGSIYMWIGRFADALKPLEESLPFAQELGYRQGIANVPLRQGYCKMQLGDYTAARVDASRAQPLTEDAGLKREMAANLYVLGCLDLVEGASARSRQRFLESASLYRETGNSGELGMALGGLGLAQRALGEEGQARETLCEVLRQWGTCREYTVLMTNLSLAAILLADEGRVELGLEILAAATQHPHVGNSRWAEDVAGAHIRRLAEELPADIRRAAECRGLARDPYETLAELSEVFNCNSL